MSKSLGNVVDPIELLDKWGADPVRYYLLREIPTGDDGDFSKERFQILYQEELANNIGNLIRRVVSMTEKYFDGKVPETDGSVDSVCEKAWGKHHEFMSVFNIRAAIEEALGLAQYANIYVDQNKPWELAKTDEEKLAPVMGNLIQLCRELGTMLEPIIPETAAKIKEHVGGEKVHLGDPLFPPIE